MGELPVSFRSKDAVIILILISYAPVMLELTLKEEVVDWACCPKVATHISSEARNMSFTTPNPDA